METANRRVLRTRSRAWPSAIARALAGWGVTPNQVSVVSIAVAAVGALGFAAAADATGGRVAPWLVLAAVGIQLRLLCNLLDGLLAIEGGLKSPTGDLYNEIPDRVADVLLLVGAGVAASGHRWGLWLGIAAAFLAVITAYVRLLGGSLGLRQDFVGPMAKQHRMFVLTVGALAGAVEHSVLGSTLSLWAALWIIVAGSAVTAVRRTGRMARALRAR